MKRNGGFAVLELVFALLLVAILFGIGGYVFFRNSSEEGTSRQTENNETEVVDDSEVIWSYVGSKWASSKTPPDCAEPIEFTFPSDIATATNTLWPGQVRGDFKAHGGVRYDNSPSGKVTVKAPYDAKVYRIGRYDFDGSGEQQSVIDFVNNCGIMYRFDHLLELSPKLEKVFANFPGDGSTSQFYNADKQIDIKQGEVLATKIGFPKAGNVFYDLGVYDLRQKNAASRSSKLVSSQPPEVAHYGVCWFDLVPGSINKTLRSLPTGQEGKVSKYC